MMHAPPSSERNRRISKFLSLILRHRPETVAIELDSAGWAAVDALLAGMSAEGLAVSFEELVDVVETNDKRRFIFSEDRTKIRAVQGHSRDVDLGYVPTPPPRLLFHGTVARFLPAIRDQGLLRGRRQFVHLSPDEATAATVGKRRGQPIVLTIDARRMHADGHLFFRADNGVWLTAQVPPGYILTSRQDGSERASTLRR